VLAAGYRKSALDDYFERRDMNAHIDVVDTCEVVELVVQPETIAR
jgi:hypothetical protein